uniref:Uncharacterized protein n=1 Tax=Molossus molossus TaxID=27622 RepID=A0A7J8B6I7_MOLMO|nr:hypothetical protein HJG59_010907 [Molossus molossus]
MWGLVSGPQDALPGSQLCKFSRTTMAPCCSLPSTLPSPTPHTLHITPAQGSSREGWPASGPRPPAPSQGSWLAKGTGCCRAGGFTSLPVGKLVGIEVALMSTVCWAQAWGPLSPSVAGPLPRGHIQLDLGDPLPKVGPHFLSPNVRAISMESASRQLHGQGVRSLLRAPLLP